MSHSTDQEHMIVRYLDANNQTILHEEVVTDKASFSLETSAADLFQKGYELLESDLPQGNFAETLMNRSYTAYVRERITIVFPSLPKSEGQAVEGFEGLYWPAGLESADLRRTCSRIISYRYDDDSEALAAVSETLVFERTAMVNHVKHQVTYMPWQPVGATGFNQIDTPPILGYQADQAFIPAVTNFGDDLVPETEHLTVTFSKEKQRAKLQVLDVTTDEVLFTDTIEGLTNDSIEYPIAELVSSYVAKGYEVLHNPLQEPVFYSGDIDEVQELGLTLRPKEMELSLTDLPQAGTPVYPDLEHSVCWPDQLLPSTLTKSIKRTLLNQHEDGRVIDTIEQKVDFVRSARVNLLTQAVFYTPWELGSAEATFPAYTPEPLAGYIPRPRLIPEITSVSPDSSDLRVIITYTKKIQRVTVQFVDTTTNGMILHQTKLVGKTGQSLNFDYDKKVQEFINNGYEIVSSDYPTEACFEAELPENAVYTVALSPKVVVVYPDDPKPAGTYIDPEGVTGPKWPVGVDEQSLRRLITRTIYHRYDNGRDALSPRVDAVLFQRQAEINLVTGHIFYSDWENERNSFEAYEVPDLDGYTANREVIAGIDGVTVDSANFDVTIYYIKASGHLTCQLVDITTGRNLGTQEVTIRTAKKMLEDIERRLEPYIAQGYYIEKPALLNLALQDSTIRDLTIELTQRVLEVTPSQPKQAHSLISGYTQLTWPSGLEASHLNQTVSREIRLAYDHGQLLMEPIVQQVTFSRQARVNLVSGEVSYDEWQTERSAFEALTLPVIEGHAPKQLEIPEEQVTVQTLNQVIDIIYYEVPKRIVIEFVDHKTNLVLATDDLFGAMNEELVYHVGDKLGALGLAGYDFIGANFPEHLIISQEEQRYSVWLSARELEVLAEAPHAPYTTTTVEGYGLFTWPHGVDRMDLISDVKRCIHYTDGLGNPLMGSPIEQEVTFKRSATVNVVTNRVTYSDWVSLEPVFPAVDLPVLEGYLPEMEQIPAFELTELSDLSDRVIDVRVLYHKQPYHLNLLLVNQLSHEILTDISLSVGLVEDAFVTIQSLLEKYQKQGYSLATDLPTLEDWLPGQERQVTIGLKPQLVTVTVEQVKANYADFDEETAEQLRLTEGLSPLELSRDVIRKIRYIYANGRTAAPSYVDTITFKRTAKVNLVTGDIFFDDWASYYPVFDDVLSPVVEGYTPSKEIVESVEHVDADSQNIAETIIYTRNIQQVIVNVIDKSTGNVIYAESITGTNGDYTPTYNLSQVVQKGYDLVSNQEPLAIPEAEVQQDASVPVVQEEPVTLTVTDDADSSVEPVVVENEPTSLPVIETVIEVGANDTEDQIKYGVDPHDLVTGCRRVIAYVYADGRRAAEKLEQELMFYRTALVNPETTTITYTDWQALGQGSFVAVESPVLEGYVADQLVVKALTPRLDVMGTQEVQVVYHKKMAEHLSVMFRDQVSGDELLTFNFPNKGNAYAEGKIEKGVSFLAYKGYEVVASDYPDNGQFIEADTERFEIHLLKSTEDQAVEEEVMLPTVVSKPLAPRTEKEEIKEKDPTQGSEQSLENQELAMETSDHPAEVETEDKTRKRKGLFSFLFKD